MMETLFTNGPLTGFPFQSQFAVGNRPLATPLFGSSIPGAGGGVPAPAPAMSPAVAPVNAYGFGSGVLPVPQGIPGAHFAGTFPFGPPPAVIVGDTTGVTAPALLAAVALRRGQPQGPTSDQEVEDFIYDALELLPGAADVEVRCEAGRATLTGSVQHKRAKRDVGEIAWAIPALIDVQNNVTITSRRRARASGREDQPSGGQARKQG